VYLQTSPFFLWLTIAISRRALGTLLVVILLFLGTAEDKVESCPRFQ